MSTLYELTDELAAAQRDLTEMLTNGVISAEEYDDSLAILLDEYEVKTVGVIAHIKNLSAQVAMYKAEIAKLNTRLKSTSNSLEFYNGYLLAQMIKTGQSEAGEGVHTAKIKKGSKRCEIVDIDAISKLYKTVKSIVTADKAAITRAIKAGEEIEGAALVAGPDTLKIN
jgi:hypothetical protein